VRFVAPFAGHFTLFCECYRPSPLLRLDWSGFVKQDFHSKFSYTTPRIPSCRRELAGRFAGLLRGPSFQQ